MAVMFLLTITAKVQAGDFTYTTNVDNSITITGYVGSGGDVTIPNKIDGFPVTIIGNSAFYSCTNIISVVIGTNVASIGSRAFTGCHSLTNVIIPESVTSIGEEAFIWCDSLTSVAIPYSVACIESSAFASCTNLTAITVDESNSFYCSMDGVLFNESQSLLIQYPGGKVGSYTIPDNVTNIRDWSFVWCNGLTSVSIPSSVVAIGWAAFGQCVNLTGVYFEGHAPNLGSESVFFGATNSTIYYLPGTTNWTNPWGGRPTALWIPYNYLTNADNTITISGYTGSGGDVVIPDTIDGMPVTSIGDKSFLGIDSLISITIPGSVVDIGNMAFSYCWNLTNVVLGTNVVCIGSFVFSGNQIHGIFVPASATNIGENAFSGVWEITVDPINPSYSSKDGVLFDKNMTTLLQYSKVKEGDYTIPASVVNIGSQAFQDCGISIVTIPTSVTNIGDSAFRMSWLSSITIPRSVVGIGYGALFSCGHMSAITVDELNPVFSSILESTEFCLS